MLTFVTVVMMLFMLVVWKMAIIIPMRENGVRERLGKFAGVLEPGFHVLIPFFDRVAYRHEIREQPLDVPAQRCITRDNIQVEVDGLVYVKVTDAARASYGIEDYRRASVNLAQTTMRSELGKLALHEVFAERDKLNVTIVKEIDKASDPWGIKVLRYEIRNIEPSPHVIHTLEKAMEAERARRAEVTAATAHKEATIAVSEGERAEAINHSEGQKQARLNAANGQAQEIKLLADASAEGIRRVASALTLPGGEGAMRMRIVEQFLREYRRIVATADVSVVPAELANIQGFFEGIGRTGQAMGQSHAQPPSVPRVPSPGGRP